MKHTHESSRDLSRNFLVQVQIFIGVSIILYFGRDLFVPIAFAALISFILLPISAWLERRGLARMPSIIICITGLIVILLGIVLLLANQFFSFVETWPSLQGKVSALIQNMSDSIIQSFGISREQQLKWISQVANQAASGIFSLFKNAISVSAFSLVMLILIPIYAVLILYYRQVWVAVLCGIFPTESKENIRKILSLTINTYYSFIKGMGLVYFSVGVLNSIGLLVLGVPHALLFGFVASILTFIPYVGILVGSLLPIAVALITFDSIWYPVGIVLIFTFVQYLEANIIFPWAVSNGLKVNTLVVLITIFIGGLLWGLAGMILFVPFVGIAKLLADHNPKLNTLGTALGTGS